MLHSQEWYKVQEMKTNIVLIVAVLVLLVVVGAQTLNQNKKIQEVKEINVTKDVIAPSPTATEPSDRALKVAAFFVVRSNETEKNEVKKKAGNENMTDSGLIRYMASILDQDPAKLAQAEADMEKVATQEKQPVYNEVQAAPVQERSSPRNCTSHTIGEFTYTNCY